MNSKEKKLQAFSDLLDIMDELREKCPWDKKQTLESLRHLTIEEVYELSDAIINQNLDEIKKEIGDILLHLIFYAKIGSELGQFDIADVINSLNEKLIFRHPHIYGNSHVENEEEVKRNWEKLKLKEGNQSVLSGVPKGLPSMIKSLRIQEKTKGIGLFLNNDEKNYNTIIQKLEYLKNENDATTKEKLIGEIFFLLINYSDSFKINADEALEQYNKNFTQLFQKMENKIMNEEGKSLSELSPEELIFYWKSLEKKTISESLDSNFLEP